MERRQSLGRRDQPKSWSRWAYHFARTTFVSSGVALVVVLMITAFAGGPLERGLSRFGMAGFIGGEAVLSAWGYGGTIVGVVTDSSCKVRHQIESTQCVRTCVAKGGKYVLDDGTTLFDLSDQRRAENYAAREVRVMGLREKDSRYLAVVSMEAIN